MVGEDIEVKDLKNFELTSRTYKKFVATYESLVSKSMVHISKLQQDYKLLEEEVDKMKEEKRFKKILLEYPEYYPMIIKTKEDQMLKLVLGINMEWSVATETSMTAFEKINEAFDKNEQLRSSNELIKSTQDMIMENFKIAKEQYMVQMDFTRDLIQKYISGLTVSIDNNTKALSKFVDDKKLDGLTLDPIPISKEPIEIKLPPIEEEVEDLEEQSVAGDVEDAFDKE